MKTADIGKKGEQAACLFLKKKKYKILALNYAKPYGEIDIIASKGDILTFVEVKTRKNDNFGRACEFVTKSKQQKIIKTAYTYINENPCDFSVSFDVIEVYHDENKITKIEHIENAFSI